MFSHVCTGSMPAETCRIGGIGRPLQRLAVDAWLLWKSRSFWKNTGSREQRNSHHRAHRGNPYDPFCLWSTTAAIRLCACYVCNIARLLSDSNLTSYARVTPIPVLVKVA